MAFSGAGSRGFFWEVPPTNIIENIHKMKGATLRKANREFRAFADEVEDWMKTNHPWNNRTGTAEDSLTAQVEGDETAMLMEIGYDLGVLQGHPDGRQRDYSIYLEGYLGLGIIVPTMQSKAPEAMDQFKGIMTL